MDRNNETPTGWLLTAAGIFLLLLSLITCKRFEPDQLVIIETGAVSDISYSSCTVTGEIYDAGSDGINQHGFVWSIEKDPLIEGNSKSELGSKDNTGTFTGGMTGLSPSTTYYIKAYGTANSETTYGKEITVTTASPTVPVLTTATVSAITDSSATCGGNITEDGGAEIMARGVCWDTTSGPTLEDSLTLDGTGTGTFSSLLRDLDCHTTYYVRAYATNSVGTAYGEEQEFSTVTCQPVLPVVITWEVTSVTDTTAMCGGNVTDDGGTEVTGRGVCWSTFPDPTEYDDFTEDGTGTGEFSSSLTGLTCNTTYYVRAYATTAVGTAYGDQKTFTTEACPIFPPEVLTIAAYDISDSAAISGGNVVSDGGAPVTARGVCWSTRPHPLPDSSHTEDGPGPGTFTSHLTDLKHLTTYYYRAYATNTEGTAFGDEFEFSTPDLPGYVTDIDRNSYPIVTIGFQVWMAENLKVSRYADGSLIPLVEGDPQWNDLTKTDKAYSFYADNPEYAEVYGALYTWAGAMNSEASSELNPSGVQGACPAGWHLPSDAEWKQLEMYLGMTQEQADSAGYRGEGYGGKLKATGTDYWKDPNAGASDEFGFSALPGGRRNNAGFSMNRTYDCWFWSSTDAGGTQPWFRSISYDDTRIWRDDWQQYAEGYSVRCVRDD